MRDRGEKHRGGGPHGRRWRRGKKAQEEVIDFRVVLLGNPNVGKSVFFYRLTKTYVIVSNFPGTSVTLTEGIGHFEGKRVRVVDTPGIYKLTPISEDERVARSVLIEEKPEIVIQISDAKNLRRSLLFTLQLLEFGIPAILVLNMWDELRNQKINLTDLEKILGIPVINTVATENIGIKKLKQTVVKLKDGLIPCNPYRMIYQEDIERAIEEINQLLPQADLPFSQRAFSLMLLEGDKELEVWVLRKYGRDRLQQIKAIIKNTEGKFGEQLNSVIIKRREQTAREIVNKVVKIEETKRSTWSEKASTVSVHKVWGPLILVGILFLIFLFVGYIGATVLVGLLEGKLFGTVINPFFTSIIRGIIPDVGAGHVAIEILVGQYGVLTTGLTWIFGLILPIVFTFFLAFAILEDSGYLSRIAVLLNQIAKKMGLSGKAMIPMILGLGCGTTAHLTTRILDTRKERIITTLLVALAIPCSAQLGIMLGFVTSYGIQWLIIGFVVILSQLFIVGYLAARIIDRKEKPVLMIELPPLRLPKPENILIKTWKRVVWFMKEAIPIFIVGTLLLSILFLTGADKGIETIFSPITGNLLGLPPGSANAFMSAILRRDLGAAVFFSLELTPVQATVGFTVLTLFLPCIASLFIIMKERGLKVALLISVFVFAYAILIGTILNTVLHLFV